MSDEVLTNEEFIDNILEHVEPNRVVVLELSLKRFNFISF